MMTSSNSHSGTEEFKACRSQIKLLQRKEKKERAKGKQGILSGLRGGVKALSVFPVKKKRDKFNSQILTTVSDNFLASNCLRGHQPTPAGCYLVFW